MSRYISTIGVDFGVKVKHLSTPHFTHSCSTGTPALTRQAMGDRLCRSATTLSCASRSGTWQGAQSTSKCATKSTRRADLFGPSASCAAGSQAADRFPCVSRMCKLPSLCTTAQIEIPSPRSRAGWTRHADSTATLQLQRYAPPSPGDLIFQDPAAEPASTPLFPLGCGHEVGLQAYRCD